MIAEEKFEIFDFLKVQYWTQRQIMDPKWTFLAFVSLACTTENLQKCLLCNSIMIAYRFIKLFFYPKFFILIFYFTQKSVLKFLGAKPKKPAIFKYGIANKYGFKVVSLKDKLFEQFLNQKHVVHNLYVANIQVPIFWVKKLCANLFMHT